LTVERIKLIAKKDPKHSRYMVAPEADATDWAIEDTLDDAIEAWILSEVTRYERTLRQRLEITGREGDGIVVPTRYRRRYLRIKTDSE